MVVKICLICRENKSFCQNNMEEMFFNFLFLLIEKAYTNLSDHQRRLVNKENKFLVLNTKSVFFLSKKCPNVSSLGDQSCCVTAFSAFSVHYTCIAQNFFGTQIVFTRVPNAGIRTYAQVLIFYHFRLSFVKKIQSFRCEYFLQKMNHLARTFTNFA